MALLATILETTVARTHETLAAQLTLALDFAVLAAQFLAVTVHTNIPAAIMVTDKTAAALQAPFVAFLVFAKQSVIVVAVPHESLVEVKCIGQL